MGRSNEVWERGEIVMCIAVPDTCILAKSNQLIKYSSPSNSQTKQKSNTLGLFVMQHKLIGHFWWEWPVKLSFCRACSIHERLMEFSRCSLSANSINVYQETKRNGIPTDNFWTSVLPLRGDAL